MVFTEQDGKFVQAVAPHVIGIRKGFDARGLWRKAITLVRDVNAASGAMPMVNIEAIQDLREHFLDESGTEVELSEEEFVEIFREVLRTRMYTDAQLRQWFHDIDVDVSNSVSWDEFTSFMIYQASGQHQTNHRAKELVYDTNPSIPMSSEHKDVVRRIVSHPRLETYISAGYDGLVKFWNPETSAPVHTINNSMQGRPQIVAGMHATIIPIADLVINGRGTALYVLGTDKTINVYEPTSYQVIRRYIGKPTSEGSDMVDAYRRLESTKDIVMTLLKDHQTKFDTYTMKCMDASPTSMDVASVLGKETIFVAFADGVVQTYVGGKQPPRAELQPMKVVQIHSAAITKIRYVRAMEAIVTSSWDCSLKLINPDTFKVTSSLDGGETHGEAHAKSVIDFVFCNTSRVIASVGRDREVRVWNPMMSTPLACLRGHSCPLQAIAFCERDDHIMTLDAENNVRVWNLRMYQHFQTVSPSAADESIAAATRYSAVYFDEERSKLVCIGNRMTSWTVRRANSTFGATHLGHTDSVMTMGFIPDTDTLVTCDTHVVMTWGVAKGQRQFLWELPPGHAPISTVALDEVKRRVFVVLKDGTVMVHNCRNGQLLRETAPGSTREEPTKAIHLTNKDLSSRVIAIMTPTEIHLYADIEDATTRLVDPKPFAKLRTKRKQAYTSAIAFPAGGKSLPSLLLVGKMDGGIALVHPNTGLLSWSDTHPMRLRTRQHSRRERLSGSGGGGGAGSGPVVAESFLPPESRGSSRDSMRYSGFYTPEQSAGNMVKAAVEDMHYLADIDLVATVVGDNTIFFWNLRHSKSIVMTYHTQLVPEECLLCLTSCSPDGTVAAPPLTELTADPPPGRRLLLSSDDHGFVYVRDISKVPTSVAPADAFDPNTQIVLLHVFRAHNSLISRINFSKNMRMVFTLSTEDCFIKAFSLSGTFIGYFGQDKRWKAGDAATYGIEDLGKPADDPKVPLPRPMTAGAMRRVTSRQDTRGSQGSRMTKNRLNSRLASKKLFSAANFVAEGSTDGAAPPGASSGGSGSGAFMTQFVSLPSLPMQRLDTPLGERNPLGRSETPIDGTGSLGGTLTDKPPLGTFPKHDSGSMTTAAHRQQGIMADLLQKVSNAGGYSKTAKATPQPRTLDALGGGTTHYRVPEAYRSHRHGGGVHEPLGHDAGSLSRGFGSGLPSPIPSPNAPNPFGMNSPTPGSQNDGALKPAVRAKKKRTGAFPLEVEVKNSLIEKPETPADFTIIGGRKQKRKRLRTLQAIPMLQDDTSRPTSGRTSVSSVSPRTSIVPPPKRSATALGIEGALSHSLLAPPKKSKGLQGADGTTVIGDSDVSYMYHLNKVMEHRRQVNDDKEKGDIAEASSEKKKLPTAMATAKEMDPRGWSQRATSLLRTMAVDKVSNPVRKWKKKKSAMK